MKLLELFESIHESFPLQAKHLDYAKMLAHKKVNGKSYVVHVFTKNVKMGTIELTFQYIINPETESWIFGVSTEDTPMVELAGGEDKKTAIEHLKKKHKINKHQIEKYFM